MRWMVAVMVLSGCAIMMQEHLPSLYDGRSEPRCSASRGWAWFDGVNFALDGAFVALEATRTDRPSSELIALFVGSAVLDGVSALVGRGWAAECESARAEYD